MSFLFSVDAYSAVSHFPLPILPFDIRRQLMGHQWIATDFSSILWHNHEIIILFWDFMGLILLSFSLQFVNTSRHPFGVYYIFFFFTVCFLLDRPSEREKNTSVKWDISVKKAQPQNICRRFVFGISLEPGRDCCGGFIFFGSRTLFLDLNGRFGRCVELRCRKGNRSEHRSSSSLWLSG